MVLAERLRPIQFLIRDRDAKFTSGFDEVFRVDFARVIRTPVRAPRANAFAERFVGTVRRECLDRVLILTSRQLQTVLSEFVDHYNTHRPHRSLDQRPPVPAPFVPRKATHPAPTRVQRRDRLGGLIHEYQLVA
jgi:putative transposase